jgi:hypothetical protein
MTIRDAEVIELLAGKPELLAIADAVSATRPAQASRPRRRRIAVRAAVLAAVVAAAIAAFLAAPQGRPGIIDHALAAVGDGPIMHVVTELPSGAVDVDLKTGRRSPLIFREELWVDRQLHHFHLVLSQNGRVVGDILYPQDAGSGTSVGSPSPGFLALWTGYRAALQNGTARLAGRGLVAGRHVYWLRFASNGQDAATMEVAVDAHTYKPVVFRVSANGVHIDQRILVAKAIAYDPADFRRRGHNLSGGSGSVSMGTSTGPVNPYAPPTTVVHAPWLTAGKTVAGLKLGSVTPLSVTTSSNGKKRSIKGLELVYGPLRHGGNGPLSTTVDELPRADEPQKWSSIPAGSVRIEVGEESSGSGSGSSSSHKLWTGYLERDGLYVTITTRKGESALLAIARSLRRAGG